MTTSHSDLIRAVCNRNWKLAETYAKVTLLNMKSEEPRDIQFRDNMLALLAKKDDFGEIPFNLKSFLQIEDPATSFHKNRYFLSDREKEVAETIIQLDGASKKLSDLSIGFLNASLLYGESGTGKTTFARYVAYKLGIPLVYMNFTSAIDAFLGSSSKNLSLAFDFVRPRRCVFMLDELDSVAMNRGGRNSGGSATAELNRITISLIHELDQMPNSVLILAATNRPDILDSAVSRRFFMRHEVKRLEKPERVQLAKDYFVDVGYTPTADELAYVSEESMTQAEEINRIVRTLVSYFTEHPDMVPENAENA